MFFKDDEDENDEDEIFSVKNTIWDLKEIFF
jgi:hypothetical protein